MSSYDPRDSQVLERKLEVQRLVIPLAITFNATPASKVLASDEPSLLFLQTQGLTQITTASGALNPGEATPTFDLTAADSSGHINMLVRVNEPVAKIVQAMLVDRATGVVYACYMNTTAAPLDASGKSLLLNASTGVSLATTSLNACLTVDYITAS